VERQPVERVLELRGELLAREHAVWRRLAARQEVAMRSNVLIERHLIRAVAPPPEAVPVARLIDRDAVDPGAQARVTAEAVQRAENFEEHFLREVQGFVAVAEEVDRELYHHALMLGHELGAGGFVAVDTLLNERRFAAADVGPPNNTGLLH